MFFELSLVRSGLVTPKHFVRALEAQLQSRPRLGRLALDSHKLTMKQVFAVLSEQSSNDKPFGEIAVELGFVTRRQIQYLLQKQRKQTRPLTSCLIEIGAIDEETLSRELSRYRSGRTSPDMSTPITSKPSKVAKGNESRADEAELAVC